MDSRGLHSVMVIGFVLIFHREFFYNFCYFVWSGDFRYVMHYCAT